MWGWMTQYGGCGWMGAGMLLFWGLVVAAIILMVKMAGGGGGCCRHKGSGNAVDLLRQRYAKGEIDHEEFEARKKNLEQ
ncbi:MAG: SHOCT domain-containing protein [Proteobacteria bacterium]|nr:SHOCT domain-containing protein [Pseudomonadota bacterium]MDE3207699.1 SHOCT domain-containing protein [Pseudomonadota bacterium]